MITPSRPTPRSHQPRTPAQRASNSRNASSRVRLAPDTAVRWVSPVRTKSTFELRRDRRGVPEHQGRHQSPLLVRPLPYRLTQSGTDPFHQTQTGRRLPGDRHRTVDPDHRGEVCSRVRRPQPGIGPYRRADRQPFERSHRRAAADHQHRRLDPPVLTPATDRLGRRPDRQIVRAGSAVAPLRIGDGTELDRDDRLRRGELGHRSVPQPMIMQCTRDRDGDDHQADRDRQQPPPHGADRHQRQTACAGQDQRDRQPGGPGHRRGPRRGGDRHHPQIGPGMRIVRRTVRHGRAEPARRTSSGRCRRPPATPRPG